MKKLLLAMALVAGISTLKAESVTLTFEIDKVTYEGTLTSTGNVQPLLSMTINPYTFTFGQASQTKPALYKSNNSLRIYAGGTMEVKGGLLDKAQTVVFHYSSIQAITADALPAVPGYTGTLDTNAKTITYTTTAPTGTFSMTISTEKVDNKSPNFQVTSMEISTDEAKPSDKMYLLSENADGWILEANNLPESLTYIWEWDSSYKNLKGSAYANNTAVVVGDNYAISPAIEVGDNASFTFEHAAKFQTSLKECCGVAVRERGTTAWTPMTITTWPTAGGWTFANAGNFDLSAYKGKIIEIGFKYSSSAAGSDTWEIKNLVIEGGKLAGVSAVYDEDADAPVVYYNFQGMKVENPTTGLYIKVQGKKSTKVYIK